MKKTILIGLLTFSTLAAYSQAILPTSWSFPTVNLPTGWTESGTNFYTASGNTPPAMKFDGTGDYLIIHVNSNPGDLTYYLTGNGFSGGTFTVEESDFGSVWTTLHSHTSPPNASYTMYTDVPQSTTRFIRFIYTNKVSGNIGLDDVAVDIGAATPAQEINVKTAYPLAAFYTVVSGDTYITPAPTLGLNYQYPMWIHNLGTADTLKIDSATITGVNSADFTVSTSAVPLLTPANILAGDSIIFMVEFTSSSLGTRIARLNIFSNDLDESHYIINLYGIGGSFASEPASQATSLTFSDIRTYNIDVAFSPTDSVDGYLVLRKKGFPITGSPVDGVMYQRGDVVSDAQVVYCGNETSFNPNNIVAAMNYHFAIYSYNGPDTFRNYLTNSPLIGDVTTPATMMPPTYYNNLSTSSSSFMNDLHALINPHQAQYYSYYDDLMVPYFEARDTSLNRRVITCVYSGENLIYTEPFDFTANGYSREHTYCHSWMPTNPAQNLPEYSDFHHLFPSNLNSANILRSNNPLGEVVNQTSSFLECKSGTNSTGQTVFEPRDEHKGDAARAIMYEAICYNSISGNNWALPSTQDQMILKKWHFQDPPDNWEIARNDFIDSLQGNRNPFVDSIDYVCFVNFSNMIYDSLACIPPSPSWDCDPLTGNCYDPGTGEGIYSSLSLCQTNCVQTSIEEVLNKRFMIYPNPAKNKLNLHVDRATISSYQIIDCLGRIVLSENVNNLHLVKLNISSLKNGVYLAKVQTPFGTAQQSILIE